MSAPVIPASLSPEAQVRALHNRALAQDLPARVSTTVLGGIT